MQSALSSAILLAAFSWFTLVAPARADEFSAVEHQRQTIYHSPQKPGFTSWVGAWTMPATLAEQRGGWTEEFDIAEHPNGDLLTIYRCANDTKRWQSTLKKSDETWIAQRAGPSVLPHSGQPELLATREGPILHVATNGIHWTSDAGQTWNKLNVPGTAYYPRSVQTKDGRIFVFGHVGGDDAYGKADQSIVMDSFRLVATDITVTDRKSLPTDKLVAERIPLGEADDKTRLEVDRWKPPSNERELIGYWKLQGDCRDHSGNNLHGTNHGVDLKTGRFDGLAELARRASEW